MVLLADIVFVGDVLSNDVREVENDCDKLEFSVEDTDASYDRIQK